MNLVEAFAMVHGAAHRVPPADRRQVDLACKQLLEACRNLAWGRNDEGGPSEAALTTVFRLVRAKVDPGYERPATDQAVRNYFARSLKRATLDQDKPRRRWDNRHVPQGQVGTDGGEFDLADQHRYRDWKSDSLEKERRAEQETWLERLEGQLARLVQRAAVNCATDAVRQRFLGNWEELTGLLRQQIAVREHAQNCLQSEGKEVSTDTLNQRAELLYQRYNRARERVLTVINAGPADTQDELRRYVNYKSRFYERVQAKETE